MPPFDALPERLELPVILKVGDNISTDEIIPAGTWVLPFRSNIPRIADFVFERIDESYSKRAGEAREKSGGHAVVVGRNYGQGSSREHAAIAPRHLGLRVVLAKGFARIHRQNLVNYGVLPLTFVDAADYDALRVGDVVLIEDVRDQLSGGAQVGASIRGGREVALTHDLSLRECAIVLAGGLINWKRSRSAA